MLSRTGLSFMENGEHWFHTEEQMAVLDAWLRQAGRHEKLSDEDR